jgi:hypothetical protein
MNQPALESFLTVDQLRDLLNGLPGDALVVSPVTLKEYAPLSMLGGGRVKKMWVADQDGLRLTDIQSSANREDGREFQAIVLY